MRARVPGKHVLPAGIQSGVMAKAAFTTLGCKVNQYETQKILESFEFAGYEVVPFDSEADLYVINSCSVTGWSGK